MNGNVSDGRPIPAASPERWPVERNWAILTDSVQSEQARTSELAKYRACGIIGAAGLGKTYELHELAAADRRHGRDVRSERLALLASTADGLESRLRSLSGFASADTAIYLDALDEVMVSVATAGLILERWIRDELAECRPWLRISCRSAVWPPGAEKALRDVYGTENCAVAILQPLSQKEIGTIAAGSGFDPASFHEAVERVKVFPLAQQPLTFKMLLHVFGQGNALPSSRPELFERGVRQLADERTERLEGGTAGEFTSTEILEAAERLACFLLLSGRDAVDLGEESCRSSLGRLELEGFPGSGRTLDYNLLRAVGRCGLCESDGERQFRFAHRQFAEYLAGRRLATLLPHQSKALLSSGLGWKAGVAAPLREAHEFLSRQAAEVEAETGLEIRAVVIDLSLPIAADGTARQ